MAGLTVDQPAQIQAGAPATIYVGANTRVKGQPGFLAAQFDTVTFSNGSVGHWVVPNTRTRVLGQFMISASSQGIAVTPAGTPVPMVVVGGDPHIRSL
jgi:hypothetical protein